MDSDDKKISQLTAAVPVATDIMPYVSRPSTAPDTKKVTIQNLLNGWVEVPDTWAYATANTITIPSGGTSIYKKGMGIRWKQGGAYKYAYITIVASTLLTVTGGTDYTVANSAITDIAYTLSPKTAVGFPPTFALGAATWNLATIDNGSGGQPNNGAAFFSVDGNIVNLKIGLIGSNATKVGTDNLIAFTVPATLPSIDELTLVPLGSAYVVAGSAGVVGISLAQSGTDLNLRYSANITDNTTTAYTSGSASFRY